MEVSQTVVGLVLDLWPSVPGGVWQRWVGGTRQTPHAGLGRGPISCNQGVDLQQRHAGEHRRVNVAQRYNRRNGES